MADLSGYSDEELSRIAGVGSTPTPAASAVSNMSDEELMKLAGVKEEQPPSPGYGLREDKTQKGTGYFGPLPAKGGKVSTEISIGVNFDGKETLIPSLVPTLSRSEIDHLLGGGRVTPEITQKAVDYARERQKQGKNPFYQEGEPRAEMPAPEFYGPPSPHRIAAAAAGGMAAMPIKGWGEIAKVLGFKKVGQVTDWIAELPNKLVVTPDEKKALEILGLPFQLVGSGYGGLAELATTGDIQKAADVVKGKSGGSNILVPIAKTAGELEAMAIAPGKVKARIREARTLRTLKAEATTAKAEGIAARRAALGVPERPLSQLAATERRVVGEGKVTAQVEREIASARKRESMREALNRYSEFEQRMGERQVTRFEEGKPFPEVITEPREIELAADRAREAALREELDLKGGRVEGFMPGEEPVVGEGRPIVSRQPPWDYRIVEGGTGRAMGPREETRVLYDAQGRPIPQGMDALDAWLERPGAPRPEGEVPPAPEAPIKPSAVPPTAPGPGGPGPAPKKGGGVPPAPSPTPTPIPKVGKEFKIDRDLYPALRNKETGEVVSGNTHIELVREVGEGNIGNYEPGWVREKGGRFLADTEREAISKTERAVKEVSGKEIKIAPVAAPAPKVGMTAKEYQPILDKYDKVPIDKFTPEQRAEYLGALRAQRADLDAKEATGLTKTEQKVLKTTKALAKKAPPTVEKKAPPTMPKVEEAAPVARKEAPAPSAPKPPKAPKAGWVPKTKEGIPAPATNTPVPEGTRIPAVELEDGTKIAGMGAKTYEEVATRKGYGASLIRKVGELDANGEWKLRPFSQPRPGKMGKSILGSQRGATTIPGDIIGAIDAAYKAGKKAIVEGKGGAAKMVEAVRKGWDLVNKEVITSGGEYLAKQTAAGKEMIHGEKGVQPTYRAGERKGGDWEYKYNVATKKLTPAQKLDVAKILDGAAPARLFGPKVQEAAILVRNILDNVAKEAGKVGLTVLHNKVQKWKVTGTRGDWKLVDEHGYVIEAGSNKAKLETLRQSYLKAPFHARENYFPHMIKRDVIEKRMDEVVAHLIKTGQIEKADAITGRMLTHAEQEAIARAKITIFMRRNSERRYGNLQIAREMELPDWAYEHNPDIVLPTYFSKSGMRIEQARNWGVKDEHLYTLADKIGEQGGDTAFARGLLDRMLFKDTPHATWDAIAKGVTGYQVVSKMGLSAISQVSQQFNSLYRGNMKSFLKAEREVFRNPEAAREWAIRAGSGLRGVAQKALEELAGTSGMPVDVYLRRVGFTAQDLRSRVVANLTGKYYAEFLADALKEKPNSAFAKRRLEGLDLNPDQIAKQGFKLTEEQLLKASQKFEIDTNFRNRVMDLPEFWTTRWGRVATQFSSFMYQQTKMLRDHVVKEALHGNLMPLVYTLTVGQVTGEIINRIRGAITGRKMPPNILRRIVENYAAAGILGMFERAWSTTRYGEAPYGPALKTLERGTNIVKQVASGNLRGAGLTAAQEVPIVGQAIHQRTQQATEVKGETTKRKNEEKWWRQHPWSLRGLTPLGPPARTVRRALSINSNMRSVGGID